MLRMLKNRAVTMIQGWLSLSQKVIIEPILSRIQFLLRQLSSFQYYSHWLLEISHLIFEVRYLRIKFFYRPLILNFSLHQLIPMLHCLMKDTGSCSVWDLYHRLGVIMHGSRCIWLIIICCRQYILLALSLFSIRI
jgi:hypothetical protein